MEFTNNGCVCWQDDKDILRAFYFLASGQSQSGTFDIADGPTLTNPHPESIVHMRGHSWHCIFYGFWTNV